MKEALLHGIYEASRELSEDSLHTMPKTMHVWAMNALFSSHKHRLPLLSKNINNLKCYLAWATRWRYHHRSEL